MLEEDPAPCLPRHGIFNTTGVPSHFGHKVMAYLSQHYVINGLVTVVQYLGNQDLQT